MDSLRYFQRKGTICLAPRVQIKRQSGRNLRQIRVTLSGQQSPPFPVQMAYLDRPQYERSPQHTRIQRVNYMQYFSLHIWKLRTFLQYISTYEFQNLDHTNTKVRRSSYTSFCILYLCVRYVVDSCRWQAKRDSNLMILL